VLEDKPISGLLIISLNFQRMKPITVIVRVMGEKSKSRRVRRGLSGIILPCIHYLSK